MVDKTRRSYTHLKKSSFKRQDFRMNALGRGIYTYTEAARFTRLHVARVRSWFTPNDNRRALFSPSYETKSGERISFLDLIDVLVAGNLRQEGVSLQAIRKVYQRLAKQYRTDHPFCHRSIFTDGQTVFLSTADDMGEKNMVEVLSSQHVFPRIIEPYLKKVSYDAETSLAKEWNIYDGITIDPEIRYGKPVVESCGLATVILNAAYLANHKDSDRVAAWYGISANDVMAAVDFEQRYLGRAA